MSRFSASVRGVNRSLAIAITKRAGSKRCAYAFCFLSLVSLPEVITSADPRKIVGWIAQTFLQLVLLPIIIVGQNIEAESSAKRAAKDRETLEGINLMAEKILEYQAQNAK